tara:strand:- start:788 stop:1504 length:717 start_codon:yes stop_codon:yes gene_type:complete
MNKTKVKSLSATQFHVKDVTVELIRKNVKNINLRVTLPEGEVRVSAPKRMPVDLIHAFVLSKYDWILIQQNKIQTIKNEVIHTYESGEMHDYLGQQYVLKCIHSDTRPKVTLNRQSLELHIDKSATREKKQAVLERWYRQQLKNQIPEFIKKYEHLMDLKVHQFGVKKMKTRWGTCNPRAKRIWLNLELIKNPLECLEYVVLHEMTHFIELKHNQRFYKIVAEYMPAWEQTEKKLSSI